MYNYGKCAFFNNKKFNFLDLLIKKQINLNLLFNS